MAHLCISVDEFDDISNTCLDGGLYVACIFEVLICGIIVGNVYNVIGVDSDGGVLTHSPN